MPIPCCYPLPRHVAHLLVLLLLLFDPHESVLIAFPFHVLSGPETRKFGVPGEDLQRGKCRSVYVTREA